jgi:hypothetical protein
MDPALAGERQLPRAGNRIDAAPTAERQLPRAVFVVATRQAVGSRGRNARPQIAAAAARA